MAKRKTKAQRDKERWDAIYKRVCDIMCAACYGNDPEYECFVPDIERLPEIVTAVKLRLIGEERLQKHTYLGGDHILEHYRSPKELTDFLFRNDVRP